MMKVHFSLLHMDYVLTFSPTNLTPTTLNSRPQLSAISSLKPPTQHTAEVNSTTILSLEHCIFADGQGFNLQFACLVCLTESYWDSQYLVK